MAWRHGALGTDNRRVMPDSGGLQRHRRLQADAAPGTLDGGVPLSFNARQFWAAGRRTVGLLRGA